MVVEERYSSVFKLDRVRPSVVADGIAECQARFPAVPIIFCDTRALAQEWTYRFLAAALREVRQEHGARRLIGGLAQAGEISPRPASTAQVRSWARSSGYDVPDRGRLRPEIWAAWTGHAAQSMAGDVSAAVAGAPEAARAESGRTCSAAQEQGSPGDHLA